MFGRIVTTNVKQVRLIEDAWVTIRGAEQHRDLRATRNMHAADVDTVRENPSFEQLERWIPPNTLLDGCRRRDFSALQALPLLPMLYQREQAIAKRVDSCFVPSVEQNDDRRNDLGI